MAEGLDHSLLSTSSHRFDSCKYQVLAMRRWKVAVFLIALLMHVLRPFPQVRSTATAEPLPPTGLREAISSEVRISPVSLAFGSRAVGTLSPAQTVSLTNTSSRALSITSIELAGPNPRDFAELDTCDKSVVAKGQCQISISFRPTRDEARRALLILAYEAAGSPQTISLSGTGKGLFAALSANQTHLVNTITDGPVFIVGDAPQTLFVQVSDADVETYLQDRASRKFNALWVYPVDKSDQSSAPKSFYGQTPFDGEDFTNEDVAYWRHVDDVLDRICAYGMIAVMDPGFVGLRDSQGYRGSYLSSSDAVMKAYGNWIGARYRNFPNIIWSLGGDADPNNAELFGKLNDLAAGILEGDPNHLLTLEAARFRENGDPAPNGGYSSLDATIMAYGRRPSWLKMNWVYNTFPTTQSGCSMNYTRSGALPALMGEDWYEGEHFMTALQVREEAYWEVLSGCTLGRLAGNNAIWSMGGPADTMGQTWQSQLASDGSTAEQWQGALMRSREFWLLAPDINHSTLVSGYGSGVGSSVAAITSDGQTIIAYIPLGNATVVGLDMTKIRSASNRAKCWWFNPRDGSTKLIGNLATAGISNFTPPDSNDWVLVIDDAGANLPSPGSAD